MILARFKSLHGSLRRGGRMKPKFRAWLKEEKRMTDVNEMTFIDGEVYLISDVTDFYAYEEFKLMQSTGLRDKNGKEIFEGDIVKFTITNGFDYVVDEYGVVNYKQGAFFIVKDFAEYLVSYVYTDEIEVICNIYENNELLEG